MASQLQENLKIIRAKVEKADILTYCIEKHLTPLSYIKATGTQYLDLNYIFSNTSKLVFEISDITKLGDNDCIMHCGQSWSSTGNAMGVSSNNLFWYYTQNSKIYTGIYSAPKLRIEVLKGNVTINNTQVISNANTNTDASEFTSIRLFASRALDKWGSYKLFSFKIYENDTLVRYYIPVKKDTGEAGLYELLTDTYILNSGTGDFIEGPVLSTEYTRVQYIENARPNDQEAWLPTDIKFSTSNTLEIKFQYSTNIDNDDRVFRFPEKTNAWWLFGRFQNKFRFTYGTGQWGIDAANMPSQDTDEHVIKANSNFYLDNTSKVSGMNFTFTDNMYFCNSIGCRLFYITYKNSNSRLLNNLIPVIRKSDNKACMYDTINDIFYLPDIEGGFIAGPEVE